MYKLETKWNLSHELCSCTLSRACHIELDVLRVHLYEIILCVSTPVLCTHRPKFNSFPVTVHHNQKGLTQHHAYYNTLSSWRRWNKTNKNFVLFLIQNVAKIKRKKSSIFTHICSWQPHILPSGDLYKKFGDFHFCSPGAITTQDLLILRFVGSKITPMRITLGYQKFLHSLGVQEVTS